MVEQQQIDGARPQCYRCHKPRLTCICAKLPRVVNRTGVWLLQHPRERFHPIGTARIARLGLDRVHLEVVHGRGRAVPPSWPGRTGLLYPSPRARDLAALCPSEHPESLVVIDGTWAQAHTLYRDNRWLQRLPHYRITPARRSRYRLRKEPSASSVSTIEAIVEALRILEPETAGLDGLLTSFDAMIDQQLALIVQHRRGRRQRQTPRSVHGLPRWSLEQPERLVVVSFEAAPRPAAGDGSPVIIHCVALRVATGEVFQHFVRPPAGRSPTSQHRHHLGLTAELLQGGFSPAELRRAWRRFVAPDDIVVAWNSSVLDALDAAVELPARRIHLKSAYRSHAKHARGHLATLVRLLQLKPVVPAPLVGRAGKHLGDLLALLAYLRAAP